MNLRGKVIPIIDLANKLGMPSSVASDGIITRENGMICFPNLSAIFREQVALAA